MKNEKKLLVMKDVIKLTKKDFKKKDKKDLEKINKIIDRNMEHMKKRMELMKKKKERSKAKNKEETVLVNGMKLTGRNVRQKLERLGLIQNENKKNNS